MDLFLIVPLNLLAAVTVADLGQSPGACSLVDLPGTRHGSWGSWWASDDLRGAVGDLARGQADAATALGLHLVLDLILVSIWLTRNSDHWACHRIHPPAPGAGVVFSSRPPLRSLSRPCSGSRLSSQ